MSSVKAMIGHTNGAASAIEAIACMLAIRNSAIPPTAGYSDQEPGFDIDYVPGTGRQQPVDVCLNNSAGFGGQNVCVVIKRPQ
jgi:3-oxoacyl-[acyl-carrier-protein] synthase II